MLIQPVNLSLPNVKDLEVKIKPLIQTEIDKMIREGVIEENMSRWRSQVLIVANEQQKKRRVVDYSQTINRLIRLDAYLPPRMDDLAAEICRNKMSCSLDLMRDYYQVPKVNRLRHLKPMENFFNSVESSLVSPTVLHVFREIT